MHDDNHYVQLIKVAKEIFEQHDEPANIRVVINENKRPVGEHARRYNSPMCDEVGVLMPNDNVNNRDIVLHYRDGSLQRISELHRGYDPLQYPLLFSYGTDGWHINLKLANGRKLTAMVYYRYHIMVRQQVPVLLKAKRLFQQFLVDAYCKIETERLQFLRREQKALRADCYQDLRDAIVDGDDDPRNVTLPDVVQLPDTMGTFVDSKEKLVSRVYPDLLSNFRDLAWLYERCILAPLNKTTHSINMTLVEQLPGDCCDYRSLDTIPDESQAVHFPTEFLNSLEVSGLPQHLLLLKVGAPIIILRSLDSPRVTNGTRCVVTKLSANTVEAKISHGRYAGHDIIIPHIPLIPSNSVLPFEFRRLQFPIALCFAMTINKSQGQTFKAVGLDLTDESFTHGMLYVALSRVGSADRLTLLVRGDCKTRNVVYSEVFR